MGRNKIPDAPRLCTLLRPVTVTVYLNLSSPLTAANTVELTRSFPGYRKKTRAATTAKPPRTIILLVGLREPSSNLKIGPESMMAQKSQK